MAVPQFQPYFMSEPSSLYLRVSLTESALEAFRQSGPKPPSAYNDWLAWLASKQFYGAIDAARIAEITYPAGTTCGSYVAECVNHPDTLPTLDHYDPASQTWTLIIGMFSENYFDFIELLTVLRNITDFKDLPGEGAILLWSYFWGVETNAYLVIGQGASRFEDQVPPAVQTEANALLKSLVDQM